MRSFATLFLITLLFTYCRGQSKQGAASVYLTNYIIPKEKEAIGFIRVADAQIKGITLAGENAKAFTISKDHLLSVKRKNLKPGNDWFDVVVNIKTKQGELTDTLRVLKDQFIPNKVIAHRGAWKNTGATENSIAALNHAVRLGCGGSEFDVHMSSDSLPVIHHDPSIDGISIAKTGSAILLTMKLSNGEYLPTLESYLKEGMKQSKTKLILEIKPSELGKQSSIALTSKVLAVVNKLRAQAWVDYISFDYDICKEAMRFAPYARVAYLKGDKTPDELAADHFSGLDYHFSVFDKNPDWISLAHQKKLTINVWTVNEKELMEKLLKQKVDFITTNEPELLLSIPESR